MKLHTGSSDVVFGVVNSGRNLPVNGIEEICGPCFNTLPVRVKLDDDNTLLDIMLRIHKSQTKQQRYQSIGLQDLLQHCVDARTHSLFDSLLVIQNLPNEDFASGISSIGLKELNTTMPANYPVMVELVTMSQERQLTLTYDGNLVSEGDARWMFNHMKTALSEIAKNVNTLVSDFSVVSTEESALLNKWSGNGTATVYNSYIHELFEKHVELAPDNIALQFETSEFVTYGELNARANRLAHLLIEFGVGPDLMVPLCIDKSIDMVVAMLAVLKAGGAYVPLDPQNPIERNRYVVSEVRAKVVVTLDRYKHYFDGVNLLLLDTNRKQIVEQSAKNPIVSELTPSNLCYVLFTSGSTGTPKGVMLEHSAVVNYMKAYKEMWDISSDDVVLQFANYTFDASVHEVFGTLVSGARLGLASKDNLLTNLEQIITSMNVSCCLLMTTIASYLNPLSVPCVKRLMVGGEMVTTAVRNSWAPHVELSNVYGPTEGTVICLKNSLTVEASCSIVGKPVGGNKIYILGSDLKPSPVGVVGELCISGPQLARGYLNRPDLTSAAFVAHPFIEGERLYLSGDLARFSADGSVEIIGRKDNQIKLHGLRIELGEVENTLNDHFKIGRACALPLVTDSKTNHKALVAFLTFSDLTENDSEVAILNGENAELAGEYINEIKELSKKNLPTYMIPSIWIPLNRMPLNTSEKVDRKFLAAFFERSDISSLSEFGLSNNAPIVQPRTENEKLIQKIWSEVLKIPQENISVDHSFRQLGGDSILAIQVSSMCRKHHIQIPVQTMLQQQNISQLADEVRLNTPEWFKPDETVEGPVILSPLQHMYFDLKQDSFNHFNMSWLFKTREYIEVDTLASAVRSLVDQHDILRARFSCTDDKWQLRVLPPAEVSFEIQSTNVSTAEELKTHIHQLQRSMNLTAGPLFQFSLYQIPNGQQLIFMSIHHYIIDLLSWRIIWEDLESLLDGHECGYKSVSYMQWSKVLYEHAQTLDMNAWPTQPKSEPVCSDVNLLAQNTMGSVRSLDFKLDAYFTKLANRYCNQSVGIDILDLLLASLAYSFCSVFERSSISIQLEFHGRQFSDNRVDISRTVGWFTNLYPVVIAVGEDDGIVDIIRQTVAQIQQIRGNEASYGLLGYLNEKTAPTFEKDPLQIFLGYYPHSLNRDSSDSLLQTIPSDSEYNVDLQAIPSTWKRHQVFSCVSQLVGEQLEASIKYSGVIFTESIVQNWLELWEESLIQAITHISNEATHASEDRPALYAPVRQNSIISPAEPEDKTRVKPIRRTSTQRNDCLALISKSNQETMFIIHCATGIASYYGSLRNYMQHTLYSLSDPTLGTSKSFESIEQMASDYVTVIREVQGEGPYYLHGYSFGGLVAFEAARQLEFQGLEVARVTIIDTLAPGVERPKDGVASRSSKEYLNLISQGGKWNLDETASRMILNKIDSNKQLMKNYLPAARKLAASIVLVKAINNGANYESLQECYGWSEYSNNVTVHTIAAEHHQLMFEPHVSKVAEYLH
ncbi:hypothetical protein K7432_010984 [Basidiobolus ranarum]|uniref:Carrier domain-containing protein n=1 Tax=Basidiobolus ranarum TaxID=34480 RepID=A0ABR2WMY0_9FUNG